MAGKIWKSIRTPLISVICSLIVTIVVALEIGSYNKDYVTDVFRSRTELSYYGARDRLVTTIDDYIQSIGPGSCLNGITLLEACEDYDTDIAFVLAQGQIESAYGTTGLAARTNSVFNVYAFDGATEKTISKRGIYKHPDESVRPYLDLLNRRYLPDKTEQDLLHNYVDCDGKRYASDKTYEVKLTQLYIHIDSLLRDDLASYRKAKILSRK